MLSTEGYFDRRPPAVVIAASLLLVGLASAADVATGRALSPSLFYFLPVALTTWRLGRRGGVAIAAVSSFAWTAADLVSHAYGSDRFPAYWNAAMRFGMLSVVASLLFTIRSRMQLERDLADEALDAAEGLRNLNEVKDTLLHAISHDLRGPIAAIVGSAHSLERRDELHLSRVDEDVLIDGILQSGRKLDRMVTDLLDLERLDRGVVEPDRSPTDLGGLIARVVREAAYAEGRPIGVEVPEAIEMDLDAGKVERIVENLLVNAVRHTPDGTPIRVRVERCAGGAVLAVEDEGPGVPTAIRAAIFEPFRQGAGVRSGAGIGLSLVARFAELHGGRAWVEDGRDGGAAFRVFLPGRTRAVPAAGRPRAATA